jgi:hypothetical protein
MNQDITTQVAEDQKAFIRKTRAIDLLIENAPLNCTRIELEITPEGHRVAYFAPSESDLKRFSFRNLHGDWIE